MCAAVSCGSAAGDVGLAGASLKWFQSLISGARRSKRQAASCYVAWLGSAIHSASFFVDRHHATPALSRQYLETIRSRSPPGATLRLFASVAALSRLWSCFGGFASLRQMIGMDARGSVQYQCP
jgi:hypothetical protein